MAVGAVKGCLVAFSGSTDRGFPRGIKVYACSSDAPKSNQEASGKGTHHPLVSSFKLFSHSFTSRLPLLKEVINKELDFSNLLLMRFKYQPPRNDEEPQQEDKGLHSGLTVQFPEDPADREDALLYPYCQWPRATGTTARRKAAESSDIGAFPRCSWPRTSRAPSSSAANLFSEKLNDYKAIVNKPSPVNE